MFQIPGSWAKEELAADQERLVSQDFYVTWIVIKVKLEGSKWLPRSTMDQSFSKLK